MKGFYGFAQEAVPEISARWYGIRMESIAGKQIAPPRKAAGSQGHPSRFHTGGRQPYFTNSSR